MCLGHGRKIKSTRVNISDKSFMMENHDLMIGVAARRLMLSNNMEITQLGIKAYPKLSYCSGARRKIIYMYLLLKI